MSATFMPILYSLHPNSSAGRSSSLVILSEAKDLLVETLRANSATKDLLVLYYSLLTIHDFGLFLP
jgi:hypothetical protein